MLNRTHTKYSYNHLFFRETQYYLNIRTPLHPSEPAWTWMIQLQWGAKTTLDLLSVIWMGKGQLTLYGVQCKMALIYSSLYWKAILDHSFL